MVARECCGVCVRACVRAGVVVSVCVHADVVVFVCRVEDISGTAVPMQVFASMCAVPSVCCLKGVLAHRSGWR